MAVSAFSSSSGHIILGIDPGTVVMGIALVQCQQKKLSLIHMGTLKMHWENDVFERLQRIYNTIDELIKTYQPHHFAIEAPFYGKNVQSMLKLGRAQGVAIACAMQHQLPVAEYSPKSVKLAITGNGNADKERVWAMLQHQMRLSEKPNGFDASDALAVAVCHHFKMQSPLALPGKKSKDWNAFVQQNQERISQPAKKRSGPASRPPNL